MNKHTKELQQMIDNCKNRDNSVHSLNMRIARHLGWDNFQFDEVNRRWEGINPQKKKEVLPNYTADKQAIKEGLYDALRLFGDFNSSETLKQACCMGLLLDYINDELLNPMPIEKYIT